VEAHEATLAALARGAEKEEWPRVAVAFGRQGLSLRVEPSLLSLLAGQGLTAADFLLAGFQTAKDCDEIAARLDSGKPLGQVTLALLDRSIRAVHQRRGPAVVALNRSLLEVEDRHLRAILVQTALVRGLRCLVAEGRPAEAGLLKKDAGLFLLLLSRHSRRVFYATRLMKNLGSVFGHPSPFVAVLTPFLARLPFVEAFDPAESEHGRAFVDARTYDGLPLSSKLSVVLGGNLAWYTVLSVRLLRVLAPLFRRLSPYYEPAYRMLGASFRKGFLLKRGFMARAVRNLLRGNLPGAVEFFWSGWNPVLVRVTIRPVYRLLGGNRRALLASTLTFLYTSVVVHPLWIILTAFAALRLALLADPDLPVAGVVASRGNFIVLVSAVGAYTVFGFLSGLAKVLRRRRALTARGGSD